MTETTNDGLILRADKTIDCSGMLCPFPMVEVAKGIKQIAVGQVLRLIATDPGAPPDMAAWARQTGHTLLDSRQENGRFIFHRATSTSICICWRRMARRCAWLWTPTPTPTTSAAARRLRR